MKSKLVCLLIAALPMAANAAGSSGTTTITSINVDSWDQIASINGSWANPDGCGVSAFAIIQFSNAYYKDMLAMALTAFATGSTVNLYFSGCVSTPWGNAPLIVEASVQH
jgi:hypothetical protein